MGDLRVTLYVRSVKTATRAKNFGVVTFATPWVGRGSVSPVTFDSETDTKYEFVLPEEQRRVVEMVEKVASEHDLEVEVIDVGKENIIHKFTQARVRKMRTFLTLVLSSGEKIEGNVTKKQLESILSAAR